MDRQIDFYLDHVQAMVPSAKKSDIEHTVYQMSQRSGIGMKALLTTLYEDLQSGIPFRYTAVGVSSSMAQW